VDIDPKTVLLDHQNNFVGILKVMSNVAKNFGIPATGLSVLYIIIYFLLNYLLFIIILIV